MILKTVLIDDEKPSLDKLAALLTHYCADSVRVVGQCQTVEAALTAFEAQKPDLIFLDVHLGDKTGFDLLAGVPLIDFDVVFSTAHDTYALRAFQADAVDYLLKPIDSDKLVKAVGKVLARSPKDRTEHYDKLAQVVNNQGRKIKRIGVPDVHGRTYIDVEAILYCRSDGGYTKFYGPRIDKDRENLLAIASEPLKDFEVALGGSNFCRIHDSHMINLAYLKSYINGRGGQVTLTDGTDLYVSDGRKAEFRRQTKSGIY